VTPLIDEIHAKGIRLSVMGGDLDILVNEPLTDEQLGFIRQHKAKLIAELNSEPVRNINLSVALTAAARGLPITPMEVRNALAPEDINDWDNGDISLETLRAFACSLIQRKEMEQGKVPAHYVHRATCASCGPVWLWFTGKVSGCPWCWNKASGKPIPRPVPVRCGDCRHFERTDHSHLGRCSKGEPEAVAGLWDVDQRVCTVYYPGHKESS